MVGDPNRHDDTLDMVPPRREAVERLAEDAATQLAKMGYLNLTGHVGPGTIRNAAREIALVLDGRIDAIVGQQQGVAEALPKLPSPEVAWALLEVGHQDALELAKYPPEVLRKRARNLALAVLEEAHECAAAGMEFPHQWDALRARIAALGKPDAAATIS